ncbi:MAG: glucuronate isomerase [Clostridia bacterium]|nr:glucuronate isomerase [Clostridia bacterium]
MSKPFLHEDFLLDTPVAARLYHTYAEKLPIIDYHCHLSPAEIAKDITFSNITEAWLYADHYKWRAMRACGVDEKYITGDASDYEKFRAYCTIMPKLAGNPLYHWSPLELRRFFGCELTINEANCDAIWSMTAEKLANGISARQLMRASDVRLVCTTDDPADSLEYHKQLADEGFEIKVLPAFRPDKSMNIERRGIVEYMKKLGEANGVTVTDLDSLCAALCASLDRFAALGCKTADHGMDNYVRFAAPDPYHANEILKKALASDGADVSDEELSLFQTQMNRFLGQEYKKRGMVLQMHFGVLRNPNRTMFKKLGPDSGFDTIHGQNCIYSLASLLNYLNENDALPRTVLYSINPVDNAAVGALCGSFCRGDAGCDGHGGMPTVTQGSAWWFNDNIDGMDAQMRSYANLAGVGNFLGMLTDSRSFMSYPRHEYFRRIWCRLIGGWVEQGLLPDDEDMLAELMRGICFENANRYFDFGL